MTSHTWVFIIISYFCFRTLLLWRSRHIETREYPARCRLTSTSATARGRGASPSALPTFLQMVIIIHPPFLLPVTLQHSYALHKLHALRSLLQLCAFSHLDSHSSYFTSAVKVLREICSPPFFCECFWRCKWQHLAEASERVQEVWSVFILQWQHVPQPWGAPTEWQSLRALLM